MFLPLLNAGFMKIQSITFAIRIKQNPKIRIDQAGTLIPILRFVFMGGSLGYDLSKQILLYFTDR